MLEAGDNNLKYESLLKERGEELAGMKDLSSSIDYPFSVEWIHSVKLARYGASVLAHD